MASKIKTFLDMIKFEHTIFALPFAYMSMFLAAAYKSGKLPSWHQFIFITIAMVAARTASMSLNRIIDREIDARNPRTANRAIPAGLLKVKEVWIYTIISLAILVLATLQLTPLAIKLLPIAVFGLVFYPYTKRFTWLCHFFLGAAIGIAPMGSWVAVTGSVDLPAWLIGIAVALWIGGFDVIYGCQDYECDVRDGINSIPVRFGIKNSLIISIIAHIASVALLIALGLYLQMGLIYYIGVAIAIVMLYYEHNLVKPNDLSKLDFAFFNMNGYLSTMMFFFTLFALFMKR